MNSLITLLEDYSFSTIVIIFILFILSILGIAEVVKKVHGAFAKYHQKVSAEEHRNYDINSRIDRLERNSNDTRINIEDLKTNVIDLKNNVRHIQENQYKANRATSRSAMYRLSKELIAKGWMSQIEYDTLNELSDVYLMSAGAGMSYVRPSLVQRALQLPVLTDEEIENLNNKESK